MKFFGKKKKPEQRNEVPKRQEVLPNDFAQHVSELEGLTPDEILKLLQSLGRINTATTVTRRRADKKGKGSKIVGGRKGKMTIDEAVEYEIKRVEERNEKEKTVRELFGLEDAEFERAELNEEIYPKRLAPNDIVRYIEAGEKNLAEVDKLKERRKKVFSPKEELVLNVATEIKKHEAPRIAQKIAERQRLAVQGKTIEELDAERKERIEGIHAEAQAIVDAAAAEEQAKIDEGLAAARTLTPFDKNLRTLTDEAAELTSENPEAAAAVMRQWIGTSVTSD